MKKEKKRLRGSKTFIKVLTEKLFPLLRKGEQNMGQWSISGHFLGF